MTEQPSPEAVEPMRVITAEATTRAGEYFAASEEQLVVEAVAKVAGLCGWPGAIDIARSGRSYLVTATDANGDTTTTAFGHRADQN